MASLCWDVPCSVSEIRHVATNLVSPMPHPHDDLMRLVVIPILGMGKLRIRIFT